MPASVERLSVAGNCKPSNPQRPSPARAGSNAPEHPFAGYSTLRFSGTCPLIRLHAARARHFNSDRGHANPACPRFATGTGPSRGSVCNRREEWPESTTKLLKNSISQRKLGRARGSRTRGDRERARRMRATARSFTTVDWRARPLRNCAVVNRSAHVSVQTRNETPGPEGAWGARGGVAASRRDGRR